MGRTMDRIFCRYGTRLLLHRGGTGTEFRGFLQSSLSKDRRYLEREVMPMGEIPGGRYVLMAPMKTELKEGDVVEQAGKFYVLRRVETVLFRDKALYLWGLCVEKGDKDTWAFQSLSR